MHTAIDIIRLLELEPHPEGGHFRETFRDEPHTGERSAGTAIYYLLAKAKSRTGTASTPARPGTGTGARRWNCASRALMRPPQPLC